MSAMVALRGSEPSQVNYRHSSTSTSPRIGQKRLRNGDPIDQSSRSGIQTPVEAQSDSATRPRFATDASIVLVGIRGSGKRSLGFIAAAALGRRFITEDHYFQNVTGFSRQDYLRVHGSEEFHKQDVEISRRMLDENRHGCVIDCGLGSLTRALQEHLKSYCQTNPVIYVHRDMNSIKKLLKLSDRSAKMLESGDPSHRRCSNFEYFNVEDESTQFSDVDDDRASPSYSFKLREAQTDFSAFVRRVTSHDGIKAQHEQLSAFSSDAAIETKLFTHSLFLPLSTYRLGQIDLTALQGGGDIIEVRIDEWQEGAARLVSRLVAEIRRELGVPVALSAAPVSDSFPVTSYFTALKHALRLVPEFLMIDLSLEKGWLVEFAAQRTCTRLIGSIRYRKAEILIAQSDSVIMQIEKALALNVDLIRLTAPALTRYDGDKFEQFVRSLKHRYAARLHFSAYLEAQLGRTTQVFNSILTSVGHETLKSAVSPNMESLPQITAFEAMQGLFSSFTLDPLHFYVFGANVSNSLSPAMHNSAYRALGFRHEYFPANVESWEDIRTRAQAVNFGGASVAQPYKVKIVDQLTSLSEHARAIGAINTLIPLRGEQGELKANTNQALYRNRGGPVFGFYGDNSDWISIQKTLSKNLSPRNAIHTKSTALVVGAGGMARAATYALLQMGCRNIFVHNRTVSNAETLVEHFATWAGTQNYATQAKIGVIRSIDDPWPEGYAQPTIIISCVTHERLPGEEHVSDFVVPEQWLRSETGGTAVEQAYYINTPFIEQLKQLHTTTGVPWVVVDGLEVLHEQATAQFEIMTGKKAPRAVMWNTLKTGVAARDGRV